MTTSAIGSFPPRTLLGRINATSLRPVMSTGIGRNNAIGDELARIFLGAAPSGAFQAAWAIGSNVVVMGPL